MHTKGKFCLAKCKEYYMSIITFSYSVKLFLRFFKRFFKNNILNVKIFFSKNYLNPYHFNFTLASLKNS